MSLPKPKCPECGTTDLTWMGGSPPYGDEQWQCARGHEWTTGPLKAQPWPAEPYAGPQAGDDDPYVNDVIGDLT